LENKTKKGRKQKSLLSSLMTVD